MNYKLAYSIVFGLAFAVLFWRIGYDTGKNDAQQFCPAVQGEKLAYSTQTAVGTECVYIKHTKSLAKTLRKM